MTTSERASALVRPIPRDPSDLDRLREEWRLISLEWSAAEDEAARLEEKRKVLLAQMKIELMDSHKMPASRAEDVARSSPQFGQHLEAMHQARRRANDLQIKKTNADRLYWDANNRAANDRAERRMTR